MLHQSSPNRPPIRDFVRRLDRVAADINVVLLVIALGLATLDITFFVTEAVVDHLPPVTHASYDPPNSAR